MGVAFDQNLNWLAVSVFLLYVSGSFQAIWLVLPIKTGHHWIANSAENGINYLSIKKLIEISFEEIDKHHKSIFCDTCCYDKIWITKLMIYPDSEFII